MVNPLQGKRNYSDGFADFFLKWSALTCRVMIRLDIHIKKERRKCYKILPNHG